MKRILLLAALAVPAVSGAATAVPAAERLAPAFVSGMSVPVARQVLICSVTMQFVVEPRGVKAVCDASSSAPVIFAGAARLRARGFEIRSAGGRHELHDAVESERLDLRAYHDPDLPYADGDALFGRIYARARLLAAAADAHERLNSALE